MKLKTKIEPQSSDELATKALRFFFIGVPGSWKTMSSATASEFYPEGGIPSDEKIVLSDLVYWAFDAGATRGFPEMGLSCPNIFDFSKLNAREFMAVFPSALEQTGKLVESGAKWLIVDTVSRLDKKLKQRADALVAQLVATKEAKTGQVVNPEDYNNKFFGYIGQGHENFFRDVTQLPCHILFLSHAKPIRAEVSDQVGLADRIKRQATKLPGGGQITAKLTGQAVEDYQADCDLFGAFVLEKVGGKDKSFIYPSGGKGYEGRSRLSRYVGKKEEPNIRALAQKVMKGIE